MSETEIERQLGIHRAALVCDLHQALRATLFDSNSSVRPDRLADIAGAEAETFGDFLRESNTATVTARGLQLCEEGVAASALLLMGQTLRRFCNLHLTGELRWHGLDVVEVYHEALLQGF